MARDTYQLWTTLLVALLLETSGALAQVDVNIGMNYSEGLNPNFNLLAVMRGRTFDETVWLVQDVRFRRTFLSIVSSQHQGWFQVSAIKELPALDEYVNNGTFGDPDHDADSEILLVTNRFLYVWEFDHGDLNVRGKPARWYLNQRGVKQSWRNLNDATRPRALELKEGEQKGSAVEVGDVTNDGKKEILVRRFSGKAGHGSSYTRISLLKFENDSIIPKLDVLYPGAGREGLQIIDFDADGINELAVGVYHTLGFLRFDDELDDFRSIYFGFELYPWLDGQRVYLQRTPEGIRLFEIPVAFRRACAVCRLGILNIHQIPSKWIDAFSGWPALGPSTTQKELSKASKWLSRQDLEAQHEITVDLDKFEEIRTLRVFHLAPQNGDWIVLNSDKGFFLWRADR